MMATTTTAKTVTPLLPMGTPGGPAVMAFTQDELQAIFHALCLAERYYEDHDAKVAGMAPAGAGLRAARLASLTPVVERIMCFANGVVR